MLTERIDCTWIHQSNTWGMELDGSNGQEKLEEQTLENLNKKEK